jgi:hypothetical protein
MVAGIETNLGSWLAGDVKLGAEAVAEATELPNLTAHRRGRPHRWHRLASFRRVLREACFWEVIPRVARGRAGLRA